MSLKYVVVDKDAPKYEYVGFCSKAMPIVTNGQATCILVSSIVFGPLALWFAACMDARGCNWNAIGFGLLMGFLPIIGWIWAIVWACECKKWNEKRETSKSVSSSTPLLQ